MNFFYWLLTVAGYLATSLVGVRLLPARWRRWLPLAYGLTTGLWVVSALGYVATLGAWSCRSGTLFAGLLLLSGWTALMRHPFGLGARLQAGLLGLGGTLLLCTSSDIVYQDATATVTVSEHFTLQNGEKYNDVLLYQSHWLLFDERVGFLSHTQGTPTSPSSEDFQRAAWWRGAQDLTFAAGAGNGQVMGPTGLVVFRFNPLR